MRKIAVALSKGGVGKSTTAVSLAYGLSKIDEKILLIDTDTQNQCAGMFGVEPEMGLSDLILDELPPMTALTECRHNLWLLSAGNNLSEAKRAISQKQFRGEETLLNTFDPYQKLFDFVILDTAPGWDSLSVNVLFYATEIISPVNLEVLSLGGLGKFVQNVEAVKQFRSELEIKFVLPTFFDGRVKKSQEILDQLTKYFSDKLCNPIRYSVRLSEAPAHGKTIFEYAPKDRGTIDYGKFVARVLNG